VRDLGKRFIPMRRACVGAILIALAVGSLTCSTDGTGPDPNAVASVIITPAGGSVDTGDSLHFSAVVRNAAGAELSEKTIRWSTLDATLATISNTGVAHGRWPGVARVVATSEQRADTAQLQVNAKIDSLVLAPRLDTLRSFGETRTLTVTGYIGGQVYDGGQYTWSRSDTILDLVPGAAPGRSARVAARFTNGTAIVRARELRGATDSARIVIRQRPKKIYFTGQLQPLRAYRACPFRLHVFVVDSLNYPVTDAGVTWSSTDTTLARIDSSGLVTPLAAGLDSIVVQAGPVSGSAALTIGVAPSVTLQISGVASRVTTVGRGQFAAALGMPAGGYTDAPARFSIVSSDTTILAVPSDTSVPLGGQPQLGPLRLVGRSLGTVTLTPYLCDVPGPSVGFTVTPPVLAVYGDVLTAARIDDPPAMLAVLTRDSTGALQAIADPVTVRVTSTDTNVVRPDSLYHHIPAGNFRADFRFTFPDSGSARLVVHDSAGLYPPDSTAVVHVGYPPIYFGDNLNFVGGDTVRVAMRQRIYRPLQPGQFGQRHLVLLDRNVVGAPIPIQLSNSDSTTVHLSPDAVTIPIGESTAPIDIAGGDVRGTATLTARSSRHLDGHLVVKTDRPSVGFYNWGSGQYPGDSLRIELAAYDSATLIRGYPTEDVIFALSVNDTSVVSLHSATLNFQAGAETSSVAFAVFKRAGIASVTVTDPRAAPYAYPPETTPAVTVLEPYLTFNSFTSVGIRQYFAGYVVENGPYDHGPIVVHVRQRSPAVLTLSDTVVTIGPGEMASRWTATGATSGVDTLIASASGFKPDTSIVTVGPGRIALTGQPPASMVVGDSFPEAFYLQAPDGTVSTTADTVVFTLAPNSNFEFHQDGALISTITIPPGQTYTQEFFYVKAKAAGTGSATISAPNYTPLTFSVTISP
jgi:hypothetical protein